MPFASALTRLEDPRIKEIGQTEVGLMGDIAYDDTYTGPAFEPAEGERLAMILGDKGILFMANHGVTTVGASVAEAYDRLYYLERAAQVQIYAMWTGQRLKQLPEPVVVRPTNALGGARFYEGPPPADRHFDALKRMLDRKEPDSLEEAAVSLPLAPSPLGPAHWPCLGLLPGLAPGARRLGLLRGHRARGSDFPAGT